MTRAERRMKPALPVAGGLPGRHQTWDETRRRIYMGIVIVGLLVQVTIWTLNLLRPHPDPVTMFSNPVFFAMSSWNLYWLYTRRPIEVVYLVALVVCGLVILARAVVTPLIGGPAMLTSLEDLYWLLVIVSIVSFLMLDYRRAIVVTAAFYGMGALLPWAMLALSGVSFAQAARLGQVQLLCAIILATLCSLSWYREHFVLERRAFELTHRVANTDALTGLHNRHALYPLLDALLERVEGGHPAALLLIDIDHFKGINDRLGHNVGDEVLREVAQFLPRHLREDDIVGRWGGEEFLVALVGISADDAVAVAERLRRAVGSRNAPPARQVTISVGVAPVIAGERLQACVSRADDALYAAKARGRNRVELSEIKAERNAETLLTPEPFQDGEPAPA
ncbi:diguanylate cyclase [Deinococcus sp. SM5_A1]|uniref:GGDEF domain-containing protein n=1 Tax=Deinococcus sp. SM5_A1 TaxID=3379094 RepID=UPI00385A205B